ncbi:MAG TPA: aminotransferase class V-fold PLP-dependent enzyme [Acidobacteriaceae bacterium]|nr:aminotransferase class V-fold PLP-dependent enzyme [Acidobacteriaceae bacterium]
MNTAEKIRASVAALGKGPLNEEGIARHIAPLFSEVLATERIYLANHSLGRPLDAMADDVAEAASLWYRKMGDAWDDWLAEREAFRWRMARLIGAERPDCVVPKTAAGQGLRAVLNALGERPRVIATRGEFDSTDVILKQYAALGRAEVRWVEPDEKGEFGVQTLIAEAVHGADLVVVSKVMYQTAQIVEQISDLATVCHQHGARLLVDAYHAVGVIPMDAQAMGADFLTGGSYKYLRGGPGAGYLYVSPAALESGLRPLDTGWFAKAEFFSFERPDAPLLKACGDAFLEGTPPVLTWYQARSGQEFTLAVGVDRLRKYGLEQLQALRGYLAESGVEDVTGGDARHGAFLAVRMKAPNVMVKALAKQGIDCDARGEWLRLCPDCLTRDEALRWTAEAMGNLLHAREDSRKKISSNSR